MSWANRLEAEQRLAGLVLVPYGCFLPFTCQKSKGCPVYYPYFSDAETGALSPRADEHQGRHLAWPIPAASLELSPRPLWVETPGESSEMVASQVTQELT